MNRSFRLALWTVLVLAVSAFAPALVVGAAPTSPPGAALAQMLPSESIMIDFGSKEMRMKKSRTEGPGMAALDSSAPDWCVSCHRNHDRVRAAKARRGRH
jgi:thiol:disulfide interchange protein